MAEVVIQFYNKGQLVFACSEWQLSSFQWSYLYQLGDCSEQ